MITDKKLYREDECLNVQQYQGLEWKTEGISRESLSFQVEHQLHLWGNFKQIFPVRLKNKSLLVGISYIFLW